MKKIIGIVSKPKMKKGDKIWNKMYIADELRYLVIKNDAIAISILPTEKTMCFNEDDFGDERKLNESEIKDLSQIINMCDGIILQGGVCSCSYEIECIKIAISLNKPVLGICAGFNNILRALGSEVIKDDTDNHNHLDTNYRHKIKINPDSLMYKIIEKEELEVNSIHSMVAAEESVNKVGTISSKSEDNYVESFEVLGKKLVMGIKWHPELMLDNEETNKIFSYFISRC